VNHLERLIDVTRRQQEMLRDATAERRSMAVRPSPRHRDRWIDRLLPLRTAAA
jgi:hypothetical protein